jgi:hypothetical protein
MHSILTYEKIINENFDHQNFKWTAAGVKFEMNV